MRTFRTNNRTFIIGIMTAGQFTHECCSGVIILTLSKYLSDRRYHYTNYDFCRLQLVAIYFLSLIVYVSVVQIAVNFLSL